MRVDPKSVRSQTVLLGAAMSIDVSIGFMSSSSDDSLPRAERLSGAPAPSRPEGVVKPVEHSLMKQRQRSRMAVLFGALGGSERQ